LTKTVTELQKLGQTVLDSQPFSQHLGAELIEFEQGRAVIALEIRPEFLQQHGFVHGGVVSYLIDNAITFAGGSVLGERVVTVEFKVNYIRPARGQRLVATATVEGAGSRLAVCRCEVVAKDGEKERRCAVGQGTIALLG
jgi:acyl-CoA thioesterase